MTAIFKEKKMLLSNISKSNFQLLEVLHTFITYFDSKRKLKIRD